MSTTSAPTNLLDRLTDTPPVSGRGDAAPLRRTAPQRTGSGTGAATAFTNFSPPSERVALTHDYLLVMRGAERTFAAIADLYRDAPIYTLLYDRQGTNDRFAGRAIATSPLQRLGVGQKSFRRLLPLYPHAVQRLRPAECDVVISSSSAFAHGMPVPEDAVHLCYCYTPFRYAWYEEQCALSEMPAVLRPLLRRQLRRIREWDLAASRRVDAYIAISALSRERIKRYYDRDAPVIHPPVEIHRFAPGKPGEALLVVSEFVRHKRLHIALEAARRARMPIRVVGSGPNHAALAEAYPEAEFLGRAGDEQLAELYAGARAVVVPSVEEFGITAVEAQAAGRPVIAAAAGGALETVIDGRTGRLARLDDPDSFAQAMRELDTLDFDPAHAVANAERFSVDTFQRRLAEQVAQALERRSERPDDRPRRRAQTRRAAPAFPRRSSEEQRWPIAACAAEQAR